jgi:thiamine kinase-like enzyme
VTVTDAMNDDNHSPRRLPPPELPAHFAPLFSHRVVRVEPIHKPHLAALKQTFRVELADGSTVKARSMVRPDHAAEWLTLRRQVGERRYLASLLAASGAWVIEEWVDGTPLCDGPATASDIEEAAAMLAELHALPYPPSSAGVDVVAQALARIETLLAALLARRAIGMEDARLLSSQAHATPPSVVHAGVMHYDFCPENLVRHAVRGLVSIDHEWLQVGALEMDLARLLARWPLDPAAQGRFVSAYHASGGRGTGDLTFWTLYVDILAAELRVRRGFSDAEDAIRRLANHRRAGGM